MQEHNSITTEESCLSEKQGKDANLNTITPAFGFVKYGIGVEDIKAEADELLKKSEATPHAEILHQLIEQFEPLDFEALANPHNAENFKLNTKHFLVLSIENALQFAEKNRWGLCKNHDFIYLYNGTFWAEIDKKKHSKSF